MPLSNRAAIGNFLAALLQGLMGGISALLAGQIYKRWGWSLFGSLIVLSFVLQLAVLPVTSKIRKHFSESSDKS